MTLDEAIKELQKVKRARAKELKADNPGMDDKKILKEAGRISLIRDSGPGYVEGAGFSAELGSYYGSSGDWTHRAVKLDVYPEY